MTSRPPVFAAVPASLGAAAGVTVSGEVDLGTAPKLTAALEAAMRASTGPFVIDLCDVSFLDSSGVNVLVRARAVLGRDDRALIVVCPPGPPRRVFELAGIVDLLELYASRADAAAALVQD